MHVRIQEVQQGGRRTYRKKLRWDSGGRTLMLRKTCASRAGTLRLLFLGEEN